MNKEYIPFHLKYRPQNFTTIIGYSKITNYLTLAIKKKKLSFAYLIIGKHGTGKTTLARIMAKAINCTNNKNIPCNNCNSCKNIHFQKSLDFYEIDGAKNTGIDNLREIIEKLNFSPITSKYKICVIDEVHMLSNSAFNSLLKTLESPPINTFFILLTTSLNKIPNTIISRCQQLFLPPINYEDICIAIYKVSCNEKIKITNKGLTNIANIAEGSFRDALNIIEMFSLESSPITTSVLHQRYLIPQSRIIDVLITKIFTLDLLELLTVINYIENHTWEIKEIINEMYNSLINKYIYNKKLNSTVQSGVINTKKLIILLLFLRDYKDSQKKNLWHYLILFMIKNNEKNIKVKKRKRNSLVVRKYKICSN